MTRDRLIEFAQSLLDADAVARARGDRFGLCDCIDGSGNLYPSQWLADLLRDARAELKLEAKKVRATTERWSTAKQWEQS